MSIQFKSYYMQQLQLEKEEIKSKRFVLPKQNKLDYLFNNKLIQQFIQEVDKLKLEDQSFVSKEAVEIAEGFKMVLSKAQIAIQKINGPKNGWKINKIDSRSELAVKVTGTNVELRYEGILQTNIQNLCIMIYQAGLFNHWVPFCNKAVQIQELSPLQKTVFLTFKIPFLTQRFAYFYALGFDRIDSNGTIVIYGQGITLQEDLLQKYGVKVDQETTKKLVLMDLKFFICEISYKSKNEFIFRCYTELDSRMPILPEWLVNTVLKQMGGFIFDKVIKKSNQFEGSIWEKKMIEEKDNPFYPWLRKRLDNWHCMNQEKGQNSQLLKSKI